MRQSLSTLLGTVSVEAKPMFSDGRLLGCGLEYTAVAQDHVYRRGGFIKVAGTIGLMASRGELGVTLKVLVLDVDPRKMSFTPSAPASAYYIAGGKTTKDAIVANIPSDTPGAIFVIFKLEPVGEIVMRGVREGRITIAFARQKGGMDIVLPIDTRVSDTNPNGERLYSSKIKEVFFECTESLIDQTIRSLEQKAR
jgi:hypothetical protein